ncbi:MAG: GNAT family N-acetyltransferase [Acidobacteria bacterium]|nr:GNAT family N-acetyltransferase [Acidobacteriota bacterium]
MRAAAIAGACTLSQPAGGKDGYLRAATADDAGVMHALIAGHLAEGHLLPREREEIASHAHRFVVAVKDDRVVACAELAPLSLDVSEVRSLVVSRDARGLGLGREIVDELVHRAATAGFEKLCAFTHAPSYFVRFGFSIVPHVWLPEKIVTDCHCCPHFRKCGQYAVLRELRRGHQACVRLVALHG